MHHYLTPVFLATLLAATPAHADLMGQPISVSGSQVSPGTASVGDGIEFVGLRNLLNFDFAADSLTITLRAESIGWSEWKPYVFTGFTEQITGLSVKSNTGFEGSLVSGSSFTPHSLVIDMSEGQACCQEDAKITFHIQTTAVPEPSSAALMCLGAIGLFASLRRKRAHERDA